MGHCQGIDSPKQFVAHIVTVKNSPTYSESCYNSTRRARWIEGSLVSTWPHIHCQWYSNNPIHRIPMKKFLCSRKKNDASIIKQLLFWYFLIRIDFYIWVYLTWAPLPLLYLERRFISLPLLYLERRYIPKRNSHLFRV